MDNTILDNIEIWTKERGRKCDTYISGWNIDITELKYHLKKIKQNCGCNGSIKNINYNELENIRVLQLQGNKKNYIIEYLKDNGIDEMNIKIKI